MVSICKLIIPHIKIICYQTLMQQDSQFNITQNWAVTYLSFKTLKQWEQLTMPVSLSLSLSLHIKTRTIDGMTNTSVYCCWITKFNVAVIASYFPAAATFQLHNHLHPHSLTILWTHSQQPPSRNLEIKEKNKVKKLLSPDTC